jgi:hypothetical protein
MSKVAVPKAAGYWGRIPNHSDRTTSTGQINKPFAIEYVERIAKRNVRAT